MRILFLTDNFPPEVNAPASRTFEHAEIWAKQGASVTVITCAPNFPQGRVYPGYRNRLYSEEWMDGIRVIRVWSYISQNKGFFRRILDYLSFSLTAFLASLWIRTDIIVATSPQFFTAVAGRWAAFFKRKPWVMEVRDLWPESIRAVGALQNDRWYNFLEKTELSLYRHANAVVTVTHAFKTNLVERGIPPDKIFVVPNGVRLEDFFNRPKDAELLESLQLDGKFVVAYIGTHGMAHALDFIVGLAPELDDDVVLLLIGDGAEKEKLKKMIPVRGISRVKMLDPVPKKEMPRYISLCDLALVNLRKSDTFKTVIPSKIFENAAMARPVLLGVEGEARALIEKYGAGRAFEPENREDFFRKLNELRYPGVYRACQAGCLELAAAYQREKLALEMLDVLKNLVPTHTSRTSANSLSSTRDCEF